MENITASKAVVYCSTEKNAITTNIGKICMLMDAIDGDYFVRDFAYKYVGNNNRMYEGQRGWIDVSNDTLKLFLKQSTDDPKKLILKWNLALRCSVTVIKDMHLRVNIMELMEIIHIQDIMVQKIVYSRL